MTSKEQLVQLVEALPEERADELLRLARGLHPVSTEEGMPRFVGIGDSGRSDVSDRSDELLGDGFGR